VSEKANAIMEKHNNWLSSENDRKIFFHALLNPPEPNAKLKQAMKGMMNSSRRNKCFTQ
jgi:uncharacterized protein (DUF1778 family)